MQPFREFFQGVQAGSNALGHAIKESRPVQAMRLGAGIFATGAQKHLGRLWAWLTAPKEATAKANHLANESFPERGRAPPSLPLNAASSHATLIFTHQGASQADEADAVDDEPDVAAAVVENFEVDAGDENFEAIGKLTRQDSAAPLQDKRTLEKSGKLDQNQLSEFVTKGLASEFKPGPNREIPIGQKVLVKQRDGTRDGTYEFMKVTTYRSYSDRHELITSMRCKNKKGEIKAISNPTQGQVYILRNDASLQPGWEAEHQESAAPVLKLGSQIAEAKAKRLGKTVESPSDLETHINQRVLVRRENGKYEFVKLLKYDENGIQFEDKRGIIANAPQANIYILRKIGFKDTNEVAVPYREEIALDKNNADEIAAHYSGEIVLDKKNADEVTRTASEIEFLRKHLLPLQDNNQILPPHPNAKT